MIKVTFVAFVIQMYPSRTGEFMTAFCENLIHLRKLKNMTQEDVAELAGVSRQAVAKWENGESLPDIEKTERLAQIFNVSLDDLVHYKAEEQEGALPLPPKGKHIFGLVTVNEKGQIVIPEKARKVFNIKPKDSLIMLGDEAQGLALMKADDFLAFAESVKNAKDGGER